MKQQQNEMVSDGLGKKKQIDFKYIVAKILGNWYWYALSLILCLGLGLLYFFYATPQYNISAKVLVNGQNGNQASSGLSETDVLSQIGLFSSQSNVNNELQIISSRTILQQTISDLQLNVTYWGQGTIRYQETYQQSPFFIKLIKIKDLFPDYDPKEYDMRIDKDKVKFRDVKTDSNFTASFGDTLHFSYGSWVLLPNPDVIETNPKHPLGVKIYTYGDAYLQYSTIYLAAVTNDDVTTIDLTLNAAVPQKGMDILQHIINLYVKSDIDANNTVADSTVAFIDGRLVGVSRSLNDIETNIENFKKQNNLADLGEQAKELIVNGSDVKKQLEQQDVQVLVIQQLIDYLSDTKNSERPMPTTAPIQDPAFVAVLDKYNSLQLDRQKYLLNGTEANPVIKGIDIQLAQQRADLIKMLTSFQKGIVVNKQNLEKQTQVVANAVQQVPTQQKLFLDYSRQQDVLQELYLYLLKTKEQTEIGKYNDISPIRIINAPQSDPKPYSPNMIMVIAASIILGLVIPTAVFFIQELLNNKVLTKEDISELTNVPVTGEVSHSKFEGPIVVNKESRSVVAEQFRILRTNLQFLLPGSNSKVILITSSMSGEGKSFIALNLAATLALAGKRTLLMEMDLRRPKLSTALGLDNSTGLTNYIVSDIKADSIIKPSGIHPDFLFIGSGSIPPNPSELLLNERLDQLFNELKNNFDYIIIDSPPVGLVTDAQLIGRFTDITFYVVKQKYTFKQQIDIIQNLYVNDKLKKLNIILNDVKKIAGYNYGYGGGYGYGYYENESSKKQSFLKKLFGIGQ